MTWRLVIDASVARAASTRIGSGDPRPGRCRSFLDAVYEICHGFVMTPELRDEWTRHESIYTAKWRHQMLGKGRNKKYRWLVPRPEVPDLLDRVLETAPTRQAREAVAKDLLLIEAALVTDRRIISCDDRAREHFRRAAEHIEELRGIIWANPVTDADFDAWLAGEREPTAEMLLGR
jgi:hypothetical protein